jgi:hypothetical protein
MHVGRVLRCLLFTLGLLHGVANAQPPQRLTAILDRSGTITVRVAGTQRVYATIRPGIFEAMWQYRTAVAGSEPGKARIRARSAGATVDMAFEARIEPGSDRTLHLQYTLIPDKEIKVNSAHIAVLTPAEDWIDTQAIQGDTTVPIPAVASKTASLLTGMGGIVLTGRGQRLACEGKELPTLLQDNRALGARDLELRFGQQSPEAGGRRWAAKKPEVFQLTLTLPAPLALIREEPVTITAGDDWIPLDETSLEIVPGSALDFSGFLDAPAGKYGRVVTTGGHFGFERGLKPQRFWGVNLGFSANYLEKAEADQLAERLARLGYNSVRSQEARALYHDRPLCLPFC